MLRCPGLRYRLLVILSIVTFSGCMHTDRRRHTAPAAPPPAPAPLLPPPAPAPQATPLPSTAEVPAIPPTATPLPAITAPPPPVNVSVPTSASAGPAPAPTPGNVSAPASPPAAPPTPLANLETPLPAPTVDPYERIQTLARLATEAIAPVETYTARLRRREQVNGHDNPEEIIAFHFRREPWSVHFKWIGTEGHGREVIYVKGHNQDQIHTLLGDNDMGRMFLPKISLPLDDPKIRAHSRHSITEAGLGSLIGRFNKFVVPEARPGGGVKYLGPVQRPEYPGKALEGVEQLVRRDLDPLMPGGGRRLWFFDPENHFPVLIVTQDATGHEVEYYCYDRLFLNIRLDDDDFNPDKLGTKSR